jgi:hypothetical protein
LHVIAVNGKTISADNLPKPAAIRVQLDRILESGWFGGSDNHRAFLTFIGDKDQDYFTGEPRYHSCKYVEQSYPI